jgi:tetratricopeptide (TPR) repeat protein
MGRKAVLIALAAALSAAWAQPAWSACKISLIAELPVTMRGHRPLVSVKVNGVDAMMAVDSGSFFNMITPGFAAKVHLDVRHFGEGLETEGVGGNTEGEHTGRADTFTLAGVTYRNVHFLVTEKGLEDDDVGLLGQNLLGVADVEYDLPDGVIRLFSEDGCGNANLAYWAKDQSYSVMNIDWHPSGVTETDGWAMINGQKIHVGFDTGSATSMLSLAAAAKAGVRPSDPGVSEGGYTEGIAKRSYIRTWLAPFWTFQIGDEEIKNFKLEIGAMGIDEDMLIGVDFFLSHRVFVSNSQHKLFFSYAGGAVFSTTNPPRPSPTLASVAATSPAPTDAEGFSRQAAALASRRDFDGAIADLTQAIKLAPNEPRYLYERALMQGRNEHPQKSVDDLNQALTVRPDYIPALLARATYYDVMLAMMAGPDDVRKREQVRADLDAADKAAAKDADARLAVADGYIRANLEREAIVELDQWIAAHPSDDRLAEALNTRCWTKALRNEDLDGALADCNRALTLEPGAPDILDSRGLVRLRRGEYEKAIADYNGSLRLQPNESWSLYGRGLAELKVGKAAAGQADLAAARTATKDMDAIAAKRGLTP